MYAGTYEKYIVMKPSVVGNYDRNIVMKPSVVGNYDRNIASCPVVQTESGFSCNRSSAVLFNT